MDSSCSNGDLIDTRTEREKEQTKHFFEERVIDLLLQKLWEKILPGVGKHTLKKVFLNNLSVDSSRFSHSLSRRQYLQSCTTRSSRLSSPREIYSELEKTRATACYEETPEGNKENKLGGGAR